MLKKVKEHCKGKTWSLVIQVFVCAQPTSHSSVSGCLSMYDAQILDQMRAAKHRTNGLSVVFIYIYPSYLDPPTSTSTYANPN